MEEIQSLWEIPAIAHFCNVFRAAFNLVYFDVGELEAAILDMQDPEMSISLEQLVTKLLEGCFNKGEVTNYNWEERLLEALEEFDENESSFSGKSFHSLSPRLKVDILLKLCHIRLDVAATEDAIKDIPAEDMQAVCLGQDSEKYSYWYFGDERLYKESASIATSKTGGKRPNPKDKKKTSTSENRKLWIIVCHSLNDWEKLAKKFSRSKSTLEKEIAKEIKNNYLERVEQTIAEKERFLRKRYLELAPKRTSSRISKIQAQRKLEEQKAAEEEEKRMEEYRREQAKKDIVQKKREIEDREKRAQKRSKIVEERAKRAQQRGMLRNFIEDYGDSNDSFDRNVIDSDSKSNESGIKSEKSDFSESEDCSGNESESDSNNQSDNDSNEECENGDSEIKVKIEKESDIDSQSDNDSKSYNDSEIKVKIEKESDIDSQSDNESDNGLYNHRYGNSESTNYVNGKHFRQKQLVHYDLTKWNSNIDSKKQQFCVLKASSSNASDQKRFRLSEDGSYKVATVNGLNSSVHKENNITPFHLTDLSKYSGAVPKKVVRIDFLKPASKQISS